MAYNKFKLKTLKAPFGIEHTSVPFLPTTYRAITPSLGFFEIGRQKFVY
jgi:hypothetical protein